MVVGIGNRHAFSFALELNQLHFSDHYPWNLNLMASSHRFLIFLLFLGLAYRSHFDLFNLQIIKLAQRLHVIFKHALVRLLFIVQARPARVAHRLVEVLLEQLKRLNLMVHLTGILLADDPKIGSKRIK